LNLLLTDILHFLLGHSLDDWARGTLSFQMPLGLIPILGGLAVLVLVMVIFHRRTTARTALRFKVALVLLRSTTLAILLFCLLKPVLITSSTTPRDSHIAILVDNSRSMTLPDMERSKTRGDAVEEMLYGEEGLIERLSRDFTVRTFAFDRSVRPLTGPAELTFKGGRTHLSQALQAVSETMQGLPQAALVVVTDGADNGEDDPLHPAGILKARHIPVHVVGMGSEKRKKDISINRVRTNGKAVEGALFELQITAEHQGYAGREAELLIESGERVVAAKKIKLGPDGHSQQHRLYLKPEIEGPRIYTARIAHRQEELNRDNNQLPFLVEKSAKRAQILYIEGHPRNEYKFIRRAVENDRAIRLKTYLMTGPQKYLRQNIESPLELADGYPDSEAALFAFDAVIFGDVSPDFFTKDQLALTRAFVSRRGGGFLMLGGATAFDAGFSGTPIADLLPVTLARGKDLPPALHSNTVSGDHPTRRLFAPRLTDEGWRSMILRLDTEDEANRQQWRDMPMLQGINVTGRAKPGATVLAVHPTLAIRGQALPVLAYERYGRGRTMAVMTATTWRWQMLKPHEDTSHERFWRQILRWLTADTPDPVEILIKPSHISTGDPVTIRARIFNEAYRPVSQATAWLKIIAPDTVVTDLEMSAEIARSGEFSAEFTVTEPGLYQLEVSPPHSAQPAAPVTRSFLVTDAVQEMRDAALNRSLLTKIAAVGGGQYYPAGTVENLVKHLKANRTTDSVDVQVEIWDIPLVFFLLLTCLGLEWLLRRRRGLS
jgi:uncharacterized membrane protein